jgi:hypothetical protein
MFGPPVKWWKVWFFLRNDIDAPLPMFMGSHPIRQPKWRYNVAQMDLRRLQSLQEVIRRLVQRRLTGEEILQTFLAAGPNILIGER